MEQYDSVRRPALLEMACAILRVPPFDSIARHIFFGCGSFPDVELAAAPQLST
jgi:hypothetical protein